MSGQSDDPWRVAYVSLGCRTNRAETDAIARELAGLGCVLSDAAEADAVVVNTCAVTGEAEAKARKAVRRAAALPQKPAVVATGCVAALFAASLSECAPGVAVVPEKTQVCEAVIGLLARRRTVSVPPAGTAGCESACGAVTPTGRTRPGIKIQDGCDLRCSYCIVWKARGPARSVPSEQVLEELARVVEAGASEVVLTGINVGSYRDPAVGDLAGLVSAALDVTSVGRIRIASIEPPDVGERLLGVMSSSGGRVAPFLHLCLQSGCDATLARMCRSYDTALFRDTVKRIREAVAGVALGTDVIVGFPGETDEEFAESVAFMREMAFSRMHVFRYSRRPGTPAAAAAGQVPACIAAQRAKRVRSLAREMRADQALQAVGTTQRVCVQALGSGVTGTLFDAVVAPSLAVGTLAEVEVRGVLEDGVTLDARPLTVGERMA